MTEKRKTTNAKPPKSITTDRLVELLKRYDEVHGNYPEHEREGMTVGVFIFHALGFSYEQASQLWQSLNLHQPPVYPDQYQEKQPGALWMI